MKRIKIILSFWLIFCMCFSVIGCSKQENNNYSNQISNFNEEKNEEKKDNFESLFEETKIIATSPELINIADYNYVNKTFITKDGNLYIIGNFSDGSKIKNISNGMKFSKFSSAFPYSVIAIDGRVYDFGGETGLIVEPRIGQVYSNLNSISIYGDRRAEIEGNKIHFLNSSSEKLYTYEFPNDETIEYFIDGKVIKTSKGFYFYTETYNKSEYTDILSTYSYSFKKISDLDNDIIFIKAPDCIGKGGKDVYFTVDKNGCLRSHEGYIIK